MTKPPILALLVLLSEAIGGCGSEVDRRAVVVDYGQTEVDAGFLVSRRATATADTGGGLVVFSYTYGQPQAQIGDSVILRIHKQWPDEWVTLLSRLAADSARCVERRPIFTSPHDGVINAPTPCMIRDVETGETLRFPVAVMFAGRKYEIVCDTTRKGE